MRLLARCGLFTPTRKVGTTNKEWRCTSFFCGNLQCIQKEEQLFHSVPRIQCLKSIASIHFISVLMGVAIPSAFLITLRLCMAASDIIAASAHVVMLTHAGSWELRIGGSPKDEWATNLGCYHNLLMAVAAAALFLMALVQILMCFNVKCLDFLRQRFLLPLVQMFFGVLTLGAAGDLGIAGGALVMIFGLVSLIVALAGGGGN